MKEMKFAICNYAGFSHSTFSHKLRRDDVFVVDEAMEDNAAFQEGLRLKNFEFVEIHGISELRNVIGITDKIIADFESALEEADAEREPEPEPEPVIDEQPEVEEEIEEEPPAEDEDIAEESTEKEEKPEEEPEEPSVAFTEIANSWQAAIKLVDKETDIEKLKFALRNDERKSVKKAIVARLKELQD